MIATSMGEIRIHGRGGQGTVVAAEILAAAFVLEGKYAANFPFFGQERRGAPVSAFVRFGLGRSGKGVGFIVRTSFSFWIRQ